ncbi:MAG: rhomboid family intramembrane serine protease [Actinobacteria bacterium]|nr:MAG: rhomboid family intramembrane serine protease [Actinomycetota bacterium]
MEVCYRHPGRETAVSCSSCGRPICTDCMTTTPVGMRCPECAREKTPVRHLRAATEPPTVTYVLLGINVAVELISLAAGGAGSGLGTDAIHRDGELSRATIAHGDVWRLVTSGFIHAGLPHLLFNMLALFVLGTLIEPVVGRFRFALIYGVSLLCGSFGALLLEPNAPVVGASGAIFGLLSAGIVVLRARGINPMQSGLGFWLLLNLLFTFTTRGISIGGHLGGLVGGALAAIVLYELAPRLRLRGPAPAVVVAALGAIAVAGSLAIS